MAKALKSRPNATATAQKAAKGFYSTREARERFGRAVDIAVASKPIHRKKNSPSRRRVP